MTTLSLHTRRGTPVTSHLNHSYPGGTLHLYPACMSNFSQFSVLIESRILTVVQKIVTFASGSCRSVHRHNTSLVLPVAQRAVCLCVLSSAAPANYLHKTCHEQFCHKPHKTVADNLPIKAYCCTNVPAFQTDFLA
jgi:hypothetical protein